MTWEWIIFGCSVPLRASLILNRVIVNRPTGGGSRYKTRGSTKWFRKQCPLKLGQIAPDSALIGVYCACAETRASVGQGARSEEKLTAATKNHEKTSQETSRCRWRISFASVLSVMEDVFSVLRDHLRGLLSNARRLRSIWDAKADLRKPTRLLSVWTLKATCFGLR